MLEDMKGDSVGKTRRVVDEPHVAPSRKATWVRACLAAIVVGIPASIGSFAGPTDAAAAASASHIMLIVEENQGYAQIIGNDADPYINSLASKYASATKWYGMTDSSLGDYVALISGTIGSYSSPTLVDELAARGISWGAYMESMPSACYTGTGVGDYSKVHNPFVYFKSIKREPSQCDRVVPFLVNDGSGFAKALNTNTAPDFMYVVPNICDDMHNSCTRIDNPIKQGDQWLKSNLPTVFNSQWYASGGIVIITWDSATTSDTSGWNTGDGGHIPTIVISATSHGAFTTGGNHYGTLRAIEEAYGGPLLGGSESAANGDLTPAF